MKVQSVALSLLKILSQKRQVHNNNCGYFHCYHNDMCQQCDIDVQNIFHANKTRFSCVLYYNVVQAFTITISDNKLWHEQVTYWRNV